MDSSLHRRADRDNIYVSSLLDHASISFDCLHIYLEYVVVACFLARNTGDVSNIFFIKRYECRRGR
jgi:hypothetical protein